MKRAQYPTSRVECETRLWQLYDTRFELWRNTTKRERQEHPMLAAAYADVTRQIRNLQRAIAKRTH